MEIQDYAYRHPQPPEKAKETPYPSEKACRRDRPYWDSTPRGYSSTDRSYRK